MPYTYTPDATATQVPAAAPGTGVGPVTFVTADGDPLNAASVWQAQKVQADYHDCIAKVLNYSAPPTTTSDKAQVAFKDAAGSVRAVLVDHNGLPTAGWITHFVEDWIGKAATISGSGNNQQLAHPLGRWQTSIDVQGGSVTGTIAPVSFGVGTGVEMQSGATNAQIMALATAFQPIDTSAATNFSSALCFDATTPNVSNVNFYLGLGNDPAAGANASGGLTTGAFFHTIGGGNWKARCVNGGIPTDVDTGVAITATNYRFRVEIHGSGSPFGAATARFFINEVLVATITTAVPLAQLYVVFALANGTNSSRTLFVGQVGLAFNRYANRDAV